MTHSRGIIQTDIYKTGDTWTVTITNGNGMKVHIEGCETKQIAKAQARDRIRELKRAGLM